MHIYETIFHINDIIIFFLVYAYPNFLLVFMALTQLSFFLFFFFALVNLSFLSSSHWSMCLHYSKCVGPSVLIPFSALFNLSSFPSSRWPISLRWSFSMRSLLALYQRADFYLNASILCYRSQITVETITLFCEFWIYRSKPTIRQVHLTRTFFFILRYWALLRINVLLCRHLFKIIDIYAPITLDEYHAWFQWYGLC